MLSKKGESHSSDFMQKLTRSLTEEETRFLRGLPFAVRFEGGELDSSFWPLNPHSLWQRAVAAMGLRRRGPRKAIVVHAGFAPDVSLEEQDAEVMTHVRNVKSDGTPSASRASGSHWVKTWRTSQKDIVVYGHDANRGLCVSRHFVGLDTGCVYGRRLSALILPSGSIVSVQAQQMYAVPGKQISGWRRWMARKLF